MNQLENQPLPKSSLLPQEVYNLMKPILQWTAQSGGVIPRSMPPIELSDIDPDPLVASELLNNFRLNIPKRTDHMGVFNFREEWEEPPLSTEMAIMGRKKNNTKEEVVRAIRMIGKGVVK